MHFSAPIAFVLLALIPFLIWLGWPQAGKGRWRDRFSLAIRLAIFLLLTFALAGSRLVQAADELAVVFLLDGSDSVNPGLQAEAEGFIREAIAEIGSTDQAAVVVFGAEALVERPFSRHEEFGPIHSIPSTIQSDLAEAIRLGLALYPSGTARRLVLLSDGLETTGDAREAAALAAAAGVQLDVVPLIGPDLPAEVMLTRLSAPTRVSAGASFSLEVGAESTLRTSATLRILADGAVVNEQIVSLQPGNNNFSLALTADQPQFARYVVRLDPEVDGYYQNNELAAFTEIIGPPRVLVVSASAGTDPSGRVFPEAADELNAALTAAGLEVERTSPDELPIDLESLSGYASVILVDVNARDLSPRKMQLLQRYVQDLGGGLVVIGGPQSYGMGGYFRTPLEEILPVDMQIKDQERFPAVSLAIVIDRSGSMAADEGGVAKITLAAEGAVRALELLNDFDEIAIIPVDTQPDQVIGPVLANEREQIIDQIRQIGAGGGGIYVRTGLEAAANALAGSPNQVKHIILLADGADSEEKEGVPELIDSLVQAGITVSSVSIGRGPDLAWLEQMAERGGGRFHFTDQAANLPQIFTQETTAIQRSYLIEERFFPTLGTTSFAQYHPIFRALQAGGLTAVPPLYGYVGTSPKTTARVILETHLADPLLAAWEYGLGRSAAWTSDATGRWAIDWVPWDGYAPFWSAVVRWTIIQDQDSALESTVSFDGEQARLTVEAQDRQDQYLNDLELQAVIISPDGESGAFDLNQTAPGRYSAMFSPAQEGAYLIRVSGSGTGDQEMVGLTSGWVLKYSPEYLHLQADRSLLSQLAEIGGGRIRELDVPGTPGQVFDHDLAGETTSQPIWPWLVGLAIFLWPIDIAIRRLMITRGDLLRAREALLGGVRDSEELVVARSERVTRLFQAKRRADTIRTESGQVTPGRDLATGSDQPQLPPSAGAADQGPVSGQKETEPAPQPAPDAGESTLAARLLAKRRQAQADSGEDEYPPGSPG